MTNKKIDKYKNTYFITLVIFIIGVFITGVIIYSNRIVPSSTQSGVIDKDATVQPSTPFRPINSSINIKNIDIMNEPFIGDLNAPVTLAYWLDFQCPFCKRFETNALIDLMNQYVVKGKLKIVFKDFQFLGSDSQTAGIAEKAVWELYPDKYFQWHKAMYKAQDEENSGFGNKESIIRLIQTIPGIDADKVSKLMEEKEQIYQKEQDADKAEGSQFGISGTPGFIIGTQRISGVQPTSVFVQLIDIELKKAQ